MFFPLSPIHTTLLSSGSLFKRRRTSANPFLYIYVYAHVGDNLESRLLTISIVMEVRCCLLLILSWPQAKMHHESPTDQIMQGQVLEFLVNVFVFLNGGILLIVGIKVHWPDLTQRR